MKAFNRIFLCFNSLLVIVFLYAFIKYNIEGNRSEANEALKAMLVNVFLIIFNWRVIVGGKERMNRFVDGFASMPYEEAVHTALQSCVAIYPELIAKDRVPKSAEWRVFERWGLKFILEKSSNGGTKSDSI